MKTLLCVSCLFFSTVHGITKYTVDQFSNIIDYQGISFSYDNSKILFSSNQNGYFDAFCVDIRTKRVSKLKSQSSKNIETITYFPTDDTFLVKADTYGNEKYQLYLVRASGRSKQISPSDSIYNIFYRWNSDRSKFYYGSMTDSDSALNIFEYDIEADTSTKIYTNTAQLQFATICQNERLIFLNLMNSNYDYDTYCYNRRTGAHKCITPHGFTARFDTQYVSTQGEIYYISETYETYKQLIKTSNVSDYATTVFAPSSVNVTAMTVSPTERYYVYEYIEDSVRKFKIYDTRSSSFLRLPSIPTNGSIRNVTFSWDESNIAFYFSDPCKGKNLYLYNLSSNTLTELLGSFPTDVLPICLVEPEKISITKDDGTIIPCLLYKPATATSLTPVPVIIYFHPESNFIPGCFCYEFHFTQQFLSNQGYAIMAINYQGTDNYWKSYFQVGDGIEILDRPVDDTLAVRNYLLKQSWVDDEQIALCGEGFGGFLTLSMMASLPDTFQLGIAMYGVSDWEGTLTGLPKWMVTRKKALYQTIGNPDYQSDLLTKLSPLTNIKNVKSPLLLMHGKNDPIIPISNSKDVVRALKKTKVKVYTLYLNTEGEPFIEKSSKKKVINSLLKVLKKEMPIKRVRRKKYDSIWD